MNLDQESEQHYSLFWLNNFKKISRAAYESWKAPAVSTDFHQVIFFNHFCNDAAP